MQQEIEVKFLAVDHDAIRAALKNAGGTPEKPMRLMRRTVFDLSGGPESGYLRVRDEGDRITMTFKWFAPDLDAHRAYEVETTVGDYDTSVA